MTTFKIVPIELSDIKLHGDTKYNSNNHGSVSPDDYLDILSQSYRIAYTHETNICLKRRTFFLW